MDKQPDKDILLLALKHIEGLLGAVSPPVMPQELAENRDFVAICDRLLELRLVVSGFAKGNLSHAIGMRGFVAGALKALQSNLRHLTWQTQQVERGDFSQEVRFLGEFSLAFNSMVIKLDQTVRELRQNEEELTVLTESLQKEIDLRVTAADALRESEARFKYLAEHDPLTGALNRRSFSAIATSELNVAHKSRTSCCVALMDVDRFKAFNDNHGHTEGDRALQHIVAVAQKQLRQSDVMGRYGGEEFAFFFGNADLEQGALVAERIRHAVESAPVRLSDETEIPVSVSIGIAVIRPEWYDPDNIDTHWQFHVANADLALYAAKNTGRNTVKVSPVMPPNPAAEPLNPGETTLTLRESLPENS